jgi:hypothetical protein
MPVAAGANGQGGAAEFAELAQQRNEKGHGKSIRRLAMTSILKRDHVGPALPTGMYELYRTT